MMMTFAQFEQVCESHPYQRKGMFYSEVWFFLQSCERRGVHAVVESGIKYGMSTTLLGVAFAGHVIAVDRNPLVDSVPGVEIVRADSMVVLPGIVSWYSAAGVGVLIDGPKGRDALRLKDRCLAAGARVVGLHDQDAGQGETRHTHTERVYRDIAASLDRFVSPEYRTKYPAGPGLAIWERA